MTTTASKFGRRIGMRPGDKFNYPRVWGEWHFYRSRWLVHSPNGKPSEGMYSVDLWGINHHRSLVDWLFHVGGKPYGGAVGFYDGMHNIFRAAGWNADFNGKDLCLKYWQQSKN